jgi:hypothetical protein
MIEQWIRKKRRIWCKFQPNGEEAITKIIKESPDVHLRILMQIILPDIAKKEKTRAF